MRFAYAAQSRIPSRDANSIHVMKMCQAFGANGHDVDLLVPNYRTKDTSEMDVFAHYGVDRNFALHYLPKRPVGGRVHRFAWLAPRWCRRERINLMYTRSIKTGWMAARMGIAVVLELHLIPRGGDGLLFAVMMRTMPRRSIRRYVVISDALKRDFQEQFGIPDEKILVAHDAADPPESATPVAIGDGASLTVGYVGHLYPGKGMELISELSQVCPWAEFHIIGGAKRDIDRWKHATHGYENLTFHGFIPPSKVAAFHAACDVLIAPYQRQVQADRGADIAAWMSPLKIFEYMAAKGAVLASDLPVIREVLTHEKDAILLPPDDVQAWTRALARLRDDPTLRRRLGETAYATFQRKYTWSVRANVVLTGL